MIEDAILLIVEFILQLWNRNELDNVKMIANEN